MMSSLRARLSALVLALLVPLCSATFAMPAADARGFGTPAPSAANQSRDPRFAVYRWGLGSAGLFQLNDASTGTVLLAFVEAEGRAVSVGLGSLPSRVLLQGASPSEVPVTGACPCNAVVIYDDGITRIVAITDASGNVISVTVVRKAIP